MAAPCRLGEKSLCGDSSELSSVVDTVKLTDFDASLRTECGGWFKAPVLRDLAAENSGKRIVSGTVNGKV